MSLASRQYSVAFENVSISAVQDLFNIAPASDKPIRLVGLTLSNVDGTTLVGDANEDMLRLSIRRMLATVTNGTGGSSATPVSKDQNDTAFGGTARVNDATTRASTSGTNSLWLPDGWNTRIPYALWFPPEMCLEASVSTTHIIVGLDTAPKSAVHCSGCLFFEEE